MNKPFSHWYWIAAFSGGLWVLFGAMAGHGALEGLAQSYFDKAHRYHIVHTLMLFFLAQWDLPGLRWVSRFFLLGIVCFSGSLYLMSVSDWPLRFVVPVGGVAFLTGWGLLAVKSYFLKGKKHA